jgi:hypothetical protein
MIANPRLPVTGVSGRFRRLKRSGHRADRSNSLQFLLSKVKNTREIFLHLYTMLKLYADGSSSFNPKN